MELSIPPWGSVDSDEQSCLSGPPLHCQQDDRQRDSDIVITVTRNFARLSEVYTLNTLNPLIYFPFSVRSQSRQSQVSSSTSSSAPSGRRESGRRASDSRRGEGCVCVCDFRPQTEKPDPYTEPLQRRHAPRNRKQ